MKVPNAPLREYVQLVMRSDPDLTFSEIARRANFMRTSRGRRQADPTALQRALGLKPTACLKGGKYYSYPNTRCSYEAALRIMRAINADPYDVGL